MAMSKYTKTLNFKVKVDKSELEKIETEFSSLQIKDVFVSSKAKKQFEDAFKAEKTRAAKLRKVNEELESLQGVRGTAASKARFQLQKEKFALTWQDAAMKLGKKIYDTAKEYITQLYEDAKRMMSNLASYSSSSKVFSEQATNLRLTWGLDSKSAYALQNALEDVGLGSVDEYLEKGWMLNEEQRNYLKEQLKLYEKNYEENEQIALEFQNFEVEWKQFKQELTVEFVHFLMENKELIKSSMKAMMQASEVLIEILATLVDMYDFGKGDERGQSTRDAATSDILSNYTNNNQRNTNVSISNTFNTSDRVDRQELLNAGTLTYQQIIEALR